MNFPEHVFLNEHPRDCPCYQSISNPFRFGTELSRPSSHRTRSTSQHAQQIMEHIVVNGSAHAACKQHIDNGFAHKFVCKCANTSSVKGPQKTFSVFTAEKDLCNLLFWFCRVQWNQLEALIAMKQGRLQNFWESKWERETHTECGDDISAAAAVVTSCAYPAALMSETHVITACISSY